MSAIPKSMEQAWEDAILLSLMHWTVRDPDVPGLDGEQLLTLIVEESTAAVERLKEKGMIDNGESYR